MATSNIKQLSDGNANGTILGQSASDLIGFYGLTTGVAQSALITSVTTTGAGSDTNAYGYSTAAQADAIVASLNAVIAYLKTLGFVATS